MNQKLKARLFVLMIFVACAAPVALSLLTYYVWKPERRMNYGELLQAAPLSFAQWADAQGKPVAANPFQGKWVMLLVDRPECGDDCVKRLYAMRQTALAMEIKKDKLAQVWIASMPGRPASELQAQYPQTKFVAANPAWLQQLPQPTEGRIFLIDPNGSPVLRYPTIPEPARMMKDLGRLLDVKRM